MSRSALMGLLLLGLLAPTIAGAAQIVARVNDEPITELDVSNRQRFLALTGGGMNDAMKARMQARFKSDGIKEEFVAYLKSKGVKTQEEAQAAKQEFIQKQQQKVQAEVLGGVSAGKRQAALDQLVNERLMLQAAREQKIVISDEEVNQVLTGMAQGGGKKLSLDEFLQQFSRQGINPATLRESTRAKIAWRQVVRRIYGSRVQSAAIPTASANKPVDDNAVFDLQHVRFPVADAGDQKALAQRMTQAEQVRQRFQGCASMATLLGLVEGASAKPIVKAKLSALPGDARAIVARAEVGRMTPPVIAGNAIESYAVCAKRIDAKQQTAAAADPEDDKRQQEFRIYSERHLKDLKDRARIDSGSSS